VDVPVEGSVITQSLALGRGKTSLTREDAYMQILRLGVSTTQLSGLLVVRFDECVDAFVLGLFAARLCVHEFV
jgi:hypothetical protein